MKNSIRLSDKHGVNPALDCCYVCGTAYGVALFGRLPGDREAPRHVVTSRAPCPACTKHLKAGVAFIQVRDGEQGADPYRTGPVSILKDEAVRRLLPPGPLLDAVLKSRLTYIEQATWHAIGLPEADGPKGGNT